MINKILNSFLHKKKEESTSRYENKTYDTNGITFILDENNEPYIHISVTNLDDNKAVFFARMLFEINTGIYAESILDILQKLAQQDDSIKLFVSKVVASWGLYNELQNNNTNQQTEPMVKPTDFVKGLRDA